LVLAAIVPWWRLLGSLPSDPYILRAEANPYIHGNWPTSLEVELRSELERLVPGLARADYEITSPADPAYNCIAWAAGDTSRWWWPDPEESDYWPPGVPREETLQVFIAAFEISGGYETCQAPDLERGFEKTAIFVANGRPAHAAKQPL
jgi:hypothetical protein